MDWKEFSHARHSRRLADNRKKHEQEYYEKYGLGGLFLGPELKHVQKYEHTMR